MTPLFQRKPPEELRSRRLPIRLTAGEHEKIRLRASAREMTVTEFVRRAALSRKADVDYEAGIVLALKDVTLRIRELQSAVVNDGVLPQDEEWRPLVSQAVAIMSRINK